MNQPKKPNSMKRDTTQTEKDILAQIGENSVLLQLSLRSSSRWKVYRSIKDSGCDIILENNESKKVKIEVKTRQKLCAKAEKERGPQFTLTEKERNSADYVICYWWEKNDYFVVPKKDLIETKNGEKTVYKFSVGKLGSNERTNKYLNNWDQLF